MDSKDRGRVGSTSRSRVGSTSHTDMDLCSLACRSGSWLWRWVPGCYDGNLTAVRRYIEFLVVPRYCCDSAFICNSRPESSVTGTLVSKIMCTSSMLADLHVEACAVVVAGTLLQR